MLCGASYQWQVGTSSWAGESRGAEGRPEPVAEKPEPWREIDRKLRRIAKRRAALDQEELALIREAIVHAIWREFGMTSIREYLERKLGYGPTVASERVRVAEALYAMPALERALATGELPYSAVREITRIATSETEGTWLDACRGKNLREIEDLLAEREPGDRPESPRNPDLRMRDLRFKVRPATEANVRLARQILEAELGERLDQDELLDALAQRVISGGGGPRERAACQVAITLCPHCQIARQTSAGTAIALRPEELACGLCDAEWIDVNGQARARQDVTPAVRKAVRLRDHDRCRVPGCRAARNIDVHHIVPRWQGGSHDAENLMLLCSGHHKALHRGAIRIAGPASTAVITKLYGADLEVEDAVGDSHVDSAVDDSHVESVLRAESAARVDTLLALRTLGFTKTEATSAVDAALDEISRPFELEQLLRVALRKCPKPTQ